MIFFDIPLLYCYTKPNSLIIYCLSSGDMYFFFGAFISSFYNSLGDFLETFGILSAILISIKSPVTSVVFLIALFEAVFIEFVVDILALSRGLLLL